MACLVRQWISPHDTCPVFPWTHHLAVNRTGLSAVAWEFTFSILNVASSIFMWCFLYWKSSNWVPSNSRCSVILWPLHIELAWGWYDLPLETEMIYLIPMNEAEETRGPGAHSPGCQPSSACPGFLWQVLPWNASLTCFLLFALIHCLWSQLQSLSWTNLLLFFLYLR